MTAEDAFRETPLVAASGRGHLPVVECLVAAGADVNLYASGGMTALSVACEAGCVAPATLISILVISLHRRVKPWRYQLGHCRKRWHELPLRAP